MKRRGAVDEAVILLAEAVLLAGLLLLSARLWRAWENPYPRLVAELLSATPPDAELFVVLPEPVRVEAGRVCYAGACYAVPIQYVRGQAWWWAKAYKGAMYVVAQNKSEGGSVEPGLNATLTVSITRLDVRDQAAGAGPAGVPVKIDGVTYYTDGSGQVQVSVWRGTHVIEVPASWSFNGGWARLDFKNWSTGEASTTIVIDVRGDTTVTAYYRDWRKLRVMYTSGGYVTVNGQQVSSGWESWLRYGASAQLQGFPDNKWPKTRWLRGANGAQPSFWMDKAQASLVMDNGYLVRARFFAVIQVSAKDDYNVAVSAPVSYSGDLTGSQTTSFTLEWAGDDNGLQASLDAQDYIDMPTYGLQIQYWLYNNQQKSDPVSVSVPPGSTHTAEAVYKRVPKLAYLSVYAKNEARGGERGAISYGGDLFGMRAKLFQLATYQLGGLQVTLFAPLKVVTGSYYLTFARWMYQVQSCYSTISSVNMPPAQPHNATAVFTRSGLIAMQVYRVDVARALLLLRTSSNWGLVEETRIKRFGIFRLTELGFEAAKFFVEMMRSLEEKQL